MQECMMRPINLRCDYTQNPCGIESQTPLLSWELTGVERAQSQSAYQVRVASQPALLQAGQADLWDSGQVFTTQMAVVYADKPLASRQRCFWQVHVWDQRGARGSKDPRMKLSHHTA